MATSLGRHLPILSLVTCALLLAFLFVFFPEIDLSIASLFYREGEGFYLKNHPIIRLLYRSVPILITTYALLQLSFLGFYYLLRKDQFKPLLHRAMYLFMVLAIGPGFISHTLLKDHLGRARPHQIEAFGGTKTFTPAWVPSDQCVKNCSFVSGHAAAAFFFLSFAFVSTRYRKTLLILGCLYGVSVSFARIAQGGHFLSDTLYAGIITYLTAYFLSLLFFKTNWHSSRYI